MDEVGGVVHAWRRVSVSPCGQWLYMVSVTEGSCVGVHVSSATRSRYYLQDSTWQHLLLEAIHAIDSSLLVVICQSEINNRYCVVLANVDHRLKTITRRDWHETPFVGRLSEERSGVIVSCFFDRNHIYLIKYTSNVVKKNFHQKVDIFHCVVEDSCLIGKEHTSMPAPEGQWNLPFMSEKRLVMINGCHSCKEVNVSAKKKKSQTIKCHGLDYPKGLVGGTLTVHKNELWMTALETTDDIGEISLWSLDLETWVWQRHPLMFPVGAHHPVKLRALSITAAGRFFLHGDCTERNCAIGAHMFVFNVRRHETPTAPVLETEAFQGFPTTVRQRQPIADDLMKSNEKISLQQFCVAHEMGYEHNALKRLFEKHQFQPFDNIDDLIMAYDSMMVVEPADTSLISAVKHTNCVDTSVEKAECSTREENETKCIVCLEAKPNVLLLPCKHISLCKACAQRIKDKCPKCNARVHSKIQDVFIG